MKKKNVFKKKQFWPNILLFLKKKIETEIEKVKLKMQLSAFTCTFFT